MGLGQGNHNGRITLKENLGKIRQVFFFAFIRCMAYMKSGTLYFTSVSTRYFVLSNTDTRYFWCRIIRTKSIYDGGEIVYNFNIKVIASVDCRVNNVIRSGRPACGRPVPTSPHNM